MSYKTLKTLPSLATEQGIELKTVSELKHFEDNHVDYTVKEKSS